MEGEEVYFKDVDDVSGAIDKMLGYTGDSLMSAISLVTNIVPSGKNQILNFPIFLKIYLHIQKNIFRQFGNNRRRNER